MKTIVGISEAKISKNADEILAAYAIGSSICISFYDPQKKIGALLHSPVPASGTDPDGNADQIFTCIDTAIPDIIKKIVESGAEKTRLSIKMAGANSKTEDEKINMIGKKNHIAVRKALWREGLLVASQDVGGATPRNVFLEIANGRVAVQCNENELEI